MNLARNIVNLASYSKSLLRCKHRRGYTKAGITGLNFRNSSIAALRLASAGFPSQSGRGEGMLAPEELALGTCFPRLSFSTTCLGNVQSFERSSINNVPLFNSKN